MKKKKNSLPPLTEDKGANLSFEELSLLKKVREEQKKEEGELPPHDTSDRGHLRRFVRKNRLVTAAAAVVLLALIALLAFGGFSLTSYFLNRPSKADFSVTLGDEDPFFVPYGEAVRDGVLYVDLRALATFSDWTVSGSEARMQFTATGNTFLRFEQKSEIATVNGERVEMKVKTYRGGESVLAKAYLTESTCFVPYEFLVKAVSEGLRFRLDSENNAILVKRVYNVYDGDMDNKEKADVLFSSESFTALPSLTESPEHEYFYSIDIEPYLPSITTEHLALVNKQNPLGEDYAPRVVDLTCATDGETQRLQAHAADALYAMMLEMEKAGIDDVYVTSSYRSYAYQEMLYEKYVDDHIAEGMSREEAEAAASQYSARPGESEHQTGLCLDFTTDSIHGQVDEDFEGTAAFTWLSQNAYRFGFILRYPKDKVSVTQYDYEPWHYRFVGREAATEIHFGSLCLEEYLASNP